MHFVQAKGILSQNNGMNIYRGCSHGCIYCDSRSKCYGFTHAFEDVEVKPQAFDWLFCVAAGFPFNVSCDNLEGDFEPDRIVFQRRVHAQVMTYLKEGIPPRPAKFIKALQDYYQTPTLTAEHFPWPEDL